MTDSGDGGDPGKWLRWLARGIGTPYAAFLVIMGLGTAIAAISDREPVTGEGVMVAVLFSGGVIGVLIAWWRERIGGLVLVVDAIVLAVFVYVTAGSNRVAAALLIPCPLLISGILFLMSWRRSVWLTTACLVALLAGAGFLFGTACKQVSGAYELILFPSLDLLGLSLRFLLALCGVALTAGLVTALVRPVWVGIIGFVLAGLALLLGWELTVASGILVLLYLLAAALYAVQVAKDSEERIRFSVRSVNEGQGMLVMALVLVACGSLAIGCAAQIEREGFSIPESYVEAFMEQMEKQVTARVPAHEAQAAVAGFREEFQRAIDEFTEQTITPYEGLIPIAVGVGTFMTLATLGRLVVLLPNALLSLVFPLLTAVGITETVTQIRDVHRLVIKQ